MKHPLEDKDSLISNVKKRPKFTELKILVVEDMNKQSSTL